VLDLHITFQRTNETENKFLYRNTTSLDLLCFIFYHKLEAFPFSNAKHCIDIHPEKTATSIIAFHPNFDSKAPNTKSGGVSDGWTRQTLVERQPGSQCQVRFKNPVQVLFFGGEICNYFVDLSNDCAEK
jgi:hypothetical protein